MGFTEREIDYFIEIQIDEKLRRENIKGKDKAKKIYCEVGAKVRKIIKELGGTMQGDLPTSGDGVK